MDSLLGPRLALTAAPTYLLAKFHHTAFRRAVCQRYSKIAARITNAMVSERYHQWRRLAKRYVARMVGTPLRWTKGILAVESVWSGLT